MHCIYFIWQKSYISHAMTYIIIFIMQCHEKIGLFQLILIIFPKLLQDNVKKKSMNENSMGNYSCLLLLCVIVITAGTIFYLRGQYMSLFQIVITRFNNSTNKSSQNQYAYNSFAQTLLENTHSIRVDGKQNNWLKSNEWSRFVAYQL